jgi:hypothetical protein
MDAQVCTACGHVFRTQFAAGQPDPTHAFSVAPTSLPAAPQPAGRVRLPLNVIGWVLFILGSLITLYHWLAFSMTAPGSDTLNLGRIADRQAGLAVGIALGSCGFLALVAQEVVRRLKEE